MILKKILFMIYTFIEKLPQSNGKEIVFLAGDLNKHVGNLSGGFDYVLSGFGFGPRNPEGERILEFSLAMDMVVCNTFIKKRDSHFITYVQVELIPRLTTF